MSIIQEVESIAGIKQARTVHPVLPVIRNRWSARSFSEKVISKASINTLLEAASWAPSAMNEQPWRYSVALKQDGEGFQKFLSLLLPGNSSWAKNAAALVFCYTSVKYSASQKENVNAFHDTGLANQNILLQATSMGIYGHIMEGFDKNKAMFELQLSDDFKPVCMIALGYPGDASLLDEPFKTREQSERKRKLLNEFVKYL